MRDWKVELDLDGRVFIMHYEAYEGWFRLEELGAIPVPQGLTLAETARWANQYVDFCCAIEDAIYEFENAKVEVKAAYRHYKTHHRGFPSACSCNAWEPYSLPEWMQRL